MSWLHNGAPLRMTRRLRSGEGADDGRVLFLEGVRERDVGVYQCKVQGGATDSALAAATVQLGGA